jgi:hypothetical protein
MSELFPRGFVLAAALALVAIFPGRVWPGEAAKPDMPGLLAASAQQLDDTCAKAAASLGVLAKEYAEAYAATAQPGAALMDNLSRQARRQGPVVGLMTYPEANKREPAFQAALPALYYYAGPELAPAAWRELVALTRVFGTLARLYAELDLSWVYLTTAGECFAIYPYLPLSDAVNNTPPTKQVFYTAAGFAGCGAGWTDPYLDLAGAGMMVTAAYPVFAGDTLLGVASRDITLKQIAVGLEAAAARDAGAVIVDAGGRVVAASGKFAEEIETSAGENGRAALHYRLPQALAGRDPGEAVSSKHAFMNAAGEAALDAAKSLAPGEGAAFDLFQNQAKYRVNVRKTRTNGWLVLGVEKI